MKTSQNQTGKLKQNSIANVTFTLFPQFRVFPWVLLTHKILELIPFLTEH